MKYHLVSSLVVGLGLTALEAATDAGPNFVVIMAEAQGWPNTSVMMDDRLPASKSTVFKTPAIERLAREGMRFAYATRCRRGAHRRAQRCLRASVRRRCT